MQIAVIIPALNEQANILATLQPLQSWRQKGHQVIVVDGGSQDDTVALAEPYTDVVVNSSPGRSLQMNLGEEATTADILLFLHADTIIDENADQLIINTITSGKRWGRFSVQFDTPRWTFRVIALLMNLRSCLTSIATGDQAMFVEHELFDQVGRFPVIPLMEDIQLSVNLKRYQRVTCLPQKVITSARRWKNRGIFKTIVLMWLLRIAYFIGVPAEKLHKLYY